MKLTRMVLTIVLLSVLVIGCVTTQKSIQQNPESFDSKLDNLVEEIIVSLSQNENSKIAIIEFSDIEGNETNLGRYLAEELTTRLYKTNKFEIVERQLLNKISQEHKLSLSGMIDANSAVELGKILGIDAIASGSITDLGSSVKINARLISTESGKVFAVASVKILKDDTIRKLLEEKTKSKNVSEDNELGDSKDDVNSNQIVENLGLKFELIEAKMINRKVTVKIIISNDTEDDIDFGMIIGFDNKKYTTMIYDGSGNGYTISGIKLGNKYKSFKNSVTQYDGIGTKIIAGISLNMELNFDKVSSQTSKISLLQINCGRKMGMVEFRNISLEK